jgi:hypothetical protein
LCVGMSSYVVWFGQRHPPGNSRAGQRRQAKIRQHRTRHQGTMGGWGGVRGWGAWVGGEFVCRILMALAVVPPHHAPSSAAATNLTRPAIANLTDAEPPAGPSHLMDADPSGVWCAPSCLMGRAGVRGRAADNAAAVHGGRRGRRGRRGRQGTPGETRHVRLALSGRRFNGCLPPPSSHLSLSPLTSVR